MMVEISIAKEFSPTPAGRYLDDGPATGEKFRSEFLLPALQGTAEKILVRFDGLRMAPNSFLEEAFGGLVRHGYTLAELKNRLVLKSDEEPLDRYLKRTWEFIENNASRIESD